MPVIQHLDVDSAAAADPNASLKHSTHSKSHHEQSSKLGTEQAHVSTSLQPHGNPNHVTSKSNPQLSAALQPVELRQANRDDLLIVMPSSIDRMPIVTASRGWRQGVRTYIAFEQEADLQNASSIFRVRTYACQATPKRIHRSLDHCMHTGRVRKRNPPAQQSAISQERLVLCTHCSAWLCLPRIAHAPMHRGIRGPLTSFEPGRPMSPSCLLNSEQAASLCLCFRKESHTTMRCMESAQISMFLTPNGTRQATSEPLLLPSLLT